MASVARNKPCPCGSGLKHKKCCLATGSSKSAIRPGTVEMSSDVSGGDVLVLDCAFDDSLVRRIKRLPGRWFDWRERVWVVPAHPNVAEPISALLAANPHLAPSPDVTQWLRAAVCAAAEITVLEHEDGTGRFALLPLSGAVPVAIDELAERRGEWRLLAFDRVAATALSELDGAQADEPTRICLEALLDGRQAPPALLEAGTDGDGEPCLELRTLWGFSRADAFRELDEVSAAGRHEDVMLEVQAQRLAVPADAALIDQLDAFLAAGPELEVNDAAARTLGELRSEHRRARTTVALSFADEAELELPGLGGELRPFQRAGVRYVLAQRRTFIADEQGLGKTVQALAAIGADDAYPAVVVCPASMKLVWERETITWLSRRRVAVVHGRSAAGWSRSGAADADIVVLNYEILEAHLDSLVRRDPSALVFDESQYCKDGRRKRTKAAIELSARARSGALRLALSGTPIMNRPSELLPQLRLLGRLGDFGSGARLGRRFRGAAGLERLHWHLRAHCYVRRLKADVLPQLPPKEMAAVPVELDNERDYRLAERDVIAWLQSQPLDLRALEARVAAAIRAEQLVRLGYLRKLAALGKLHAALAWIEDFLSSGEPLVVFAHHREVQAALCERFPQAARVLGGDDARARAAAIERFQDPGGPQLIVCSLHAASQGITLTRASNVAFLELDWTPARHDQAEDRCHRIGQDDTVTAWYLLARDSIDEAMADVLHRKRGVIGAITDGKAIEDEAVLAVVVRELRGRVPRELAAAA